MTTSAELRQKIMDKVRSAKPDRSLTAAALDMARQDAKANPSGQCPEVLERPYVDSTGLKGGDAGHGGESSVTFTMSDCGSHTFALTMPSSVWRQVSRNPIQNPEGTVTVMVTTDDNDGHPPARISIIAQGDWEQDGLETAMRDAWIALAKAHNRG
jgi:hypothetical protein